MIMLCRVTQAGQVMEDSSDKTGSTVEGNGKPLQYSCLENPMNSMKRHKGRTLKDELPSSVGVQYATGVQWKNNSRKTEEMEPKPKQHPVLDMTGDEVKSEAVKSKTTSDQIKSVAQLCPTLCNTMNRSTPGLPVHHQLPEFTETHVHRVSDAIQPSHPLSSPSPSAPNPSQHQSLFQ